MISRSPEDRQFYEARQKFLHDEQARLMAARQEGRQEGELVGKIQLLEELLGAEPTALAELRALGRDMLKARLDELKRSFRNFESS